MFTEFKRLVLILISFFIVAFSYAQGLGNSPYSRIGIGDIMNNRGTMRNMGMGSAGSTLMSKEYINLLNPAGIANFKYKYKDSLVKFDVGFTVQFNTLKNDVAKSSSNGANINHIAFVFPISKVYSTGIVLAPYSIVQNSYSYQAPVENDPNNLTAKYKYIGSGGIYQFQWMNGMGLTKNLSVGLTTAFNFGNITQEASSQLVTNPFYPDIENEVGSTRKTAYSGLSFKPGAIYEKQLFRKDSVFYLDPYGIRHDTIKKVALPIYFKLGASVEFFPSVQATETRNLFVRNSKNLLTTDSLLTKTSARAYFPTTMKIGTSFEKPGNWTLAADFLYSDWSAFARNAFKNDGLNATSLGFNLGGEFTPQFNESKDRKKTYRAHRTRTYRAGLMYTSTPILIDGHRLYDYSFSIGASIPVGVRTKTDQARLFVPQLPKINIALVAGQRTTFAADQLSETYYRIQLSMVIYDRWFMKRRIQ
jgi:hypothetical protein